MKMLILLSISPMIVFLLHAFVLRWLQWVTAQRAAVISVLFGHIPMGLLLWYFVFRGFTARGAELVSAVFYCFIVYNALAYTYFHIFNMSETARRIRMLYELERAGPLSASDIISMYGTPHLIGVRLDRLVDLGQLSCNDGHYVLKGKALYYAALLVSAWRRILGFKQIKVKSD